MQRKHYSKGMTQRDQAVSEQQAGLRIVATVERTEHYRYLKALYGARQPEDPKEKPVDPGVLFP